MNSVFQVITNLKSLYRIEHKIDSDSKVSDETLCEWLDMVLISLTSNKNKGTIPFAVIMEICHQKEFDFEFVFFGGDKIECSECYDVLTDKNRLSYEKRGITYYRGYCRKCKNAKNRATKSYKTVEMSSTCNKCDAVITKENEAFKIYKNENRRLNVCKDCILENNKRRSENLQANSIECKSCGKTKNKRWFNDGSDICQVCEKPKPEAKKVAKRVCDVCEKNKQIRSSFTGDAKTCNMCIKRAEKAEANKEVILAKEAARAKKIAEKEAKAKVIADKKAASKKAAEDKIKAKKEKAFLATKRKREIAKKAASKKPKVVKKDDERIKKMKAKIELELKKEREVKKVEVVTAKKRDPNISKAKQKMMDIFEAQEKRKLETQKRLEEEASIGEYIST